MIVTVYQQVPSYISARRLMTVFVRLINLHLHYITVRICLTVDLNLT